MWLEPRYELEFGWVTWLRWQRRKSQPCRRSNPDCPTRGVATLLSKMSCFPSYMLLATVGRWTVYAYRYNSRTVGHGKTGDCSALHFDTAVVRQHSPFLLSDSLVALERHERCCYCKSVSLFEYGSRFVPELCCYL